jgi:hypothetical protein
MEMAKIEQFRIVHAENEVEPKGFFQWDSKQYL